MKKCYLLKEGSYDDSIDIVVVSSNEKRVREAIIKANDEWAEAEDNDMVIDWIEVLKDGLGPDDEVFTIHEGQIEEVMI